MTRTAAIDILKEELHHCCEHLTSPNKAPEFYKELGDYCDALRMAIDALKQPEIVRCKDCKWASRDCEWCLNPDSGVCGDDATHLYIEPNWYCADGERKENK